MLELSIANRLKKVNYAHLVDPFRFRYETDNAWRCEFWGKIVRSAILSWCGDPDPETDAVSAADFLRAALPSLRPYLKKMSRRERKRAVADIARRLQGDMKCPAAISALRDARRPQADMADLGKRIMANRNPNYK